ncbi:MAG: MipA/OmpV family protein [Coxiellaceae bacterium]|nr:MAG: MipA/OmpV family protein [Coxiellaceae bacterium]
MKPIKFISGLFLGILSLPALAEAQQADGNWHLTVGAGTILTPAFLGASEYNLSLFPNVRVMYKDLFFASVEGVGLSLVNNHGWQFGPIVKYRFPRNETNGTSPFKIAGPDSTALRGLGDVNGVFEAGGFAKYTWERLQSKWVVVQGTNSPYGLLATWDVNYFYHYGHLYYSFGPHASWANGQYNNTYFGINATQSINSGLPMYSADAGIVNYGVGATLFVPLSKHILTAWFGSYDRLTGSVADSPLVQQRGSENQFVIGMSVGYRWDI